MGIHTIFIQNESKANHAERVIRTMKNLMYRYFLKKRTYRYVDVLQYLVTSYNQRPHRSLGERAPATVNKDNADEIRLVTYITTRGKSFKLNIIKSKKSVKSMSAKNKNKPLFRYKIGDDESISKLKHRFQRDYQQNGPKSVSK